MEVCLQEWQFPVLQVRKKDDGSSITVLVEKVVHLAKHLANNTAADFEKEKGCKVVVDAVAILVCMMLSTEIKAGQAALMMFHAWILYGWQLLLMQSNHRTDADTSDFLPTLEESGTVDGNLLGYPMWVNAKILIYRKDLIPEDKVPKTWDEYKALAKRNENRRYVRNNSF